jgi:hypothetical protein
MHGANSCADILLRSIGTSVLGEPSRLGKVKTTLLVSGALILSAVAVAAQPTTVTLGTATRGGGVQLYGQAPA